MLRLIMLCLVNKLTRMVVKCTSKTRSKRMLMKSLNDYKKVHICTSVVLKGMPGITETLKKVADSKGIDWDEMQKDLKKNHQWHVKFTKQNYHAKSLEKSGCLFMC